MIKLYNNRRRVVCMILNKQNSIKIINTIQLGCSSNESNPSKI